MELQKAWSGWGLWTSLGTNFSNDSVPSVHDVDVKMKFHRETVKTGSVAMVGKVVIFLCASCGRRCTAQLKVRLLLNEQKDMGDDGAKPIADMLQSDMSWQIVDQADSDLDDAVVYMIELWSIG